MSMFTVWINYKFELQSTRWHVIPHNMVLGTSVYNQAIKLSWQSFLMLCYSNLKRSVFGSCDCDEWCVCKVFNNSEKKFFENFPLF